MVSVEVSEARHIEFFLRPRNDPRMSAYEMLNVVPGNPTKIGGNAFPLGHDVPTEALRIDARAAFWMRNGEVSQLAVRGADPTPKWR